MRRLTSICCLSLLLLLQYGRAISYLGCRLEGVLTSEKVSCDCDINPDAGVPYNSIPPNQHFHYSFDDFDVAKPVTLPVYGAALRSYYTHYCAPVCAGFGSLPEQPPAPQFT